MSQKEITLAEFSDELKERLSKNKSVDCCKDELLRLADIVKESRDKNLFFSTEIDKAIEESEMRFKCQDEVPTCPLV